MWSIIYTTNPPDPGLVCQLSLISQRLLSSGFLPSVLLSFLPLFLPSRCFTESHWKQDGRWNKSHPRVGSSWSDPKLCLWTGAICSWLLGHSETRYLNGHNRGPLQKSSNGQLANSVYTHTHTYARTHTHMWSSGSIGKGLVYLMGSKKKNQTTQHIGKHKNPKPRIFHLLKFYSLFFFMLKV